MDGRADAARASRPSNSNRWKHEPVGNEGEDRSRGTASSPRSTSRADRRPRRFRATATGGDEWSSDEEMFDLIHRMRTRIITSPCFGSGKVIGAILFERTMDGTVDGKPVPQALIERGDRALHQDRQGARGGGERSPDDEADARADRPARGGEATGRVRDQGAVGDQPRQPRRHHRGRSGSSSMSPARCSAHGLVPIIEPEVNIKSPERDAADRILRDEILGEPRRGRRAGHARAVDPGRGGPVRAAGAPFQGAARGCLVGRVLARRRVPRAGPEPGDDRQLQPRAAGRFAPRQSDEEFDRTLGTAIDEIYDASTAKVPA